MGKSSPPLLANDPSPEDDKATAQMFDGPLALCANPGVTIRWTAGNLAQHTVMSPWRSWSERWAGAAGTSLERAIFSPHRIHR